MSDNAHSHEIISVCREVIKTRQYKYVNTSQGKVLVDIITAKVVTTVYDALRTEEAKIRFANLQISKMVDLAFKSVKLR